MSHQAVWPRFKSGRRYVFSFHKKSFRQKDWQKKKLISWAVPDFGLQLNKCQKIYIYNSTFEVKIIVKLSIVLRVTILAGCPRVWTCSYRAVLSLFSHFLVIEWVLSPVFSWSIFLRTVIDHMICYNLNWPKIK